MKRRKFIQNLGMGIPPVFISKTGVNFQNDKTYPEYNYTQPTSLDEAVTEDENPSNICEVRNWKRGKKSSALYLKSQKSGYHKPGQDRLPQGINRIFQMVAREIDSFPKYCRRTSLLC